MSAQQSHARRSVKSDAPEGSEVIVCRQRSPKPTVVFDTYWRFACERQSIFFRRVKGDPDPWTDDPILKAHRFTNAYRASDRVSQYLINRVIEGSRPQPADTVFRVLLFKFFNRIGTWQLLEEALGEIHANEFEVAAYDAILDGALAKGQKLYSAAYIMPCPHLGAVRKHTNHLRLLEMMMQDRLPQQLAEASSLEAAFRLLSAYPSMGSFLAYQYVIDLNYSGVLNFSEMDFVVPGPGALGGIQKCFSDLDGLAPSDIIRFTADTAEAHFGRLGLRFQTLWGRPLQLIDCQNLFCEVDKYARQAHPDMLGKLGRTRIKQNFRPDSSPIDYGFPSKWNLDVSVARSQPQDGPISERGSCS